MELFNTHLSRTARRSRNSSRRSPRATSASCSSTAKSPGAINRVPARARFAPISPLAARRRRPSSPTREEEICAALGPELQAARPAVRRHRRHRRPVADRNQRHLPDRNRRHRHVQRHRHAGLIWEAIERRQEQSLLTTVLVKPFIRNGYLAGRFTRLRCRADACRGSPATPLPSATLRRPQPLLRRGGGRGDRRRAGAPRPPPYRFASTTGWHGRAVPEAPANPRPRASKCVAKLCRSACGVSVGKPNRRRRRRATRARTNPGRGPPRARPNGGAAERIKGIGGYPRSPRAPREMIGTTRSSSVSLRDPQGPGARSANVSAAPVTSDTSPRNAQRRKQQHGEVARTDPQARARPPEATSAAPSPDRQSPPPQSARPARARAAEAAARLLRGISEEGLDLSRGRRRCAQPFGPALGQERAQVGRGPARHAAIASAAGPQNG